MRRPTILLAGAALALLLAVAPAAFAEVSVQLNSVGHVTGLNVTADLETGSIWGKSSNLPDEQVLNPDGDLLGDRMPTSGIIALPTQDAVKDPPKLRMPGLASSGSLAGSLPGNMSGRMASTDIASASGSDPHTRQTAVVAWPRFDGTNWQIVYSWWDYKIAAWRTPGFVAKSTNGVDDFDPQIYVRGKRIYLLWRRSDDVAAFDVTSGFLTASGTTYELNWDTPTEVIAPPGYTADQVFEWSFPRVINSGIGNSPLSTPVDESFH